MIGMLILINVVVFLIDGLFDSQQHRITNALAVSVGTLTRPWLWWQFLTYGFAHAPAPNYWHMLGNMLVLFFLGRDIEARYGSREFLRLYLAMIVVAGLVWAITERLQGIQNASAVGASGAVTGIVILYALNFPRRILLLFFVLPLPAWVVGLFVVLTDAWGALGAMQRGGTQALQIAFYAHLGGTAFAFLYFYYGWSLTRLTSGWPSLTRLRRRPRLRVHTPDPPKGEDSELSQEVDRILEKIHREGEASLSRKERRTLENASRQYQKKRENHDEP